MYAKKYNATVWFTLVVLDQKRECGASPNWDDDPRALAPFRLLISHRHFAIELGLAEERGRRTRFEKLQASSIAVELETGLRLRYVDLGHTMHFNSIPNFKPNNPF